MSIESSDHILCTSTTGTIVVSFNLAHRKGDKLNCLRSLTSQNIFHKMVSFGYGSWEGLTR